MRTIQMIVKPEGDSLFLIGFNKETSELKFRSSIEPSYLQEEKIQSDGKLIYTNTYFFPVAFLDKFLTELDSQ